MSWWNVARRWIPTCAKVGAAFTVGTLYTAACKPMDTPEYLTPYYLHNSRRRFNRYASIRKDGKRFMNAEDFVCALLATKETNLADPRAAEDIEGLFRAVDANGDGILSFGEFSLLMIMLSTGRSDLELAFKMFDRSGAGGLTLPEFKFAMGAFGDAAARPQFTGPLIEKLFGSGYTGRCPFSALEHMINDLKMEVLKAEFRQFDPQRKGMITAEQFGSLLANQMLGSHLPFHIVENLRKLNKHQRPRAVLDLGVVQQGDAGGRGDREGGPDVHRRGAPADAQRIQGRCEGGGAPSAQAVGGRSRVFVV